MPAGTTWPKYLTFLTASMASMLAGSQVVHNFYKPLENLDVLVEEYQKQKSEMDVGEFLRLKRRAAQPVHAATSAADSSVD